MNLMEKITLRNNLNEAYKKVTANKETNQIVKGWINYFRIGKMKTFMKDFGMWLRHKIQVTIIKQWKRPKTIYKNLNYINNKYRNGFKHENIFKVAYSRLGLYRKSGMDVVNYILNPKLLETKIKGRPALVNLLSYYLR